jgi:hypothetical protein
MCLYFNRHPVACPGDQIVILSLAKNRYNFTKILHFVQDDKAGRLKCVRRTRVRLFYCKY